MFVPLLEHFAAKRTWTPAIAVLRIRERRLKVRERSPGAVFWSSWDMMMFPLG
jgi:hypothetical protein